MQVNSLLRNRLSIIYAVEHSELVLFQKHGKKGIIKYNDKTYLNSSAFGDASKSTKNTEIKGANQTISLRKLIQDLLTINFFNIKNPNIIQIKRPELLNIIL